jgi:hypothetical protein
VLVSENLRPLLRHLGLPRESMIDGGLRFVRRKFADGYAYLVVNRSGQAVDGWVPLSVSARAAGVFDPMREKLGVAAMRVPSGGGVEVYLQLLPGESAVLRTFDSAVQGPRQQKASGPARNVHGNWSLRFVEGGPQLPAAPQIAQLGSWTAFDGDAYRSFSGTARYTLSFAKPFGEGAAWLLDFGKVADSGPGTGSPG